MQTLEVPVIDISPFLTESSTSDAFHHVVRSFDSGMRAHGMVQLVGSSVPTSSVDLLSIQAREFFEQPLENKMQYALHAQYGAGGYVPPGVEVVAATLGEDARPDLVESLVVHVHDKQTCPASVIEAAQKFISEIDVLLGHVMRLMASALGLEATFFEKAYSSPENSLRLASYPPGGAGGIAYGAHTDYTGFTFLKQEVGARGNLQVRDDEGEWYNIPAIPGAFVVNAGDLIERWTNGIYKSPVHRVVICEDAMKARLSVVYFTGPSSETLVVPLDTCRKGGQPPLYEPVYSGQWLKEKLQLSNK